MEVRLRQVDAFSSDQWKCHERSGKPPGQGWSPSRTTVTLCLLCCFPSFSQSETWEQPTLEAVVSVVSVASVERVSVFSEPPD